jgi:hypothetical protein
MWWRAETRTGGTHNNRSTSTKEQPLDGCSKYGASAFLLAAATAAAPMGVLSSLRTGATTRPYLTCYQVLSIDPRHPMTSVSNSVTRFGNPLDSQIRGGGKLATRKLSAPVLE